MFGACCVMLFSVHSILKALEMMKFLLLAVAVLCAKASDVVILTVDNFEEQVCVCILYAYS